MVSVKRVLAGFFFAMFICSGMVFAARDTTVTTPIKECEGYYESFTQCSRVMPDGKTQTGNGACRCSGGMLSGGCGLPKYTYTDRMLSINGGGKTRTCTVAAETRNCNGMNQIVDTTPQCGPWITEPGAVESECLSGMVMYRPNPSDDCKTQMKQCCTSASGNTWSEWDGLCSFKPVECVEKMPCNSDADCCNGRTCPAAGGIGSLRICSLSAIVPDCSEADKPKCSAISGGTCSYTCICSNGIWTNCTKQESCKAGYESVRNSDGSLCCQAVGCGKPNANGLIAQCLCDYGPELIKPRWTRMGTTYGCTGHCPAGTPSAGAACPENWVGNYCTVATSGFGSEAGMCTEYLCQY